MLKYIALCLCISFSIGTCGVLNNLNINEGAKCEWAGIKGKCVKETQCFTTLDKRSDPHPVCNENDDVKIICCTDCQLVNDTRNVVMSPTSGSYFWKDGTKARDNCLQYLNDLSYKCRDGGSYSGIRRSLNEKKKCHDFGLWGVGGAPPPNYVPGVEYPHQALLGFGTDLATANWAAGGAVLSNKFILTAADFGSRGIPKFVALGIKKLLDGPTLGKWQTHEIKTFIPHPDHEANSKYNDIALLELETPITFNKDVLPACLHVEATDDDAAITAYWKDPEAAERNDWNEPLKAVYLEKITEEQCKNANPAGESHEVVNYDRQVCYASKTPPPTGNRGTIGQPLLVDTQFSSCIYTVIGVAVSDSGPRTSNVLNLYTRVAPYKPWIESVVWA